MTIQRVFLGLDRPPLLAAAELLLQRYRAGRTVDMGPAVVALPGAAPAGVCWKCWSRRAKRNR